MLNKRRSFGTRKVSPPQPTCMSEEQKTTYLRDLRNSRPARPIGSRPLPSKPAPITSIPTESASTPISVALNRITDAAGYSSSKRYSLPVTSTFGSSKGRPLVQAPEVGRNQRRVTPPELQYRESAARALEKEEAHFIRRALEERDFQDDESRVYQAAQLEAADLVWKHRNPELADQEITAPYRNPDLSKKKYVILEDGSAFDRASHRRQSPADAVAPLKVRKRPSIEAAENRVPTAPQSARRRSSGTRKVSNGLSRGVFRNPEDQIYEEPSQIETTMGQAESEKHPLQSTTLNKTIRGARPLPEKPGLASMQDLAKLNRVDIYKNPPSQSRDAGYRINDSLRSDSTEEIETANPQPVEIRSDDIRAATSMRRSDRSPKLPIPTAVSDRTGRPIVSFDPTWQPEANSRGASLDMERPSSRSLPMRPATMSQRGNLDEEKPPLKSSTSRSSFQTQHNDVTAYATQNNNAIPMISITDEPISESEKSRTIPEIQIQQETCKTAPVIPQINVDDQTQPDIATPAIRVTSEESSKTSARPLPPASNRPANRPANRVPWLSRGNAPTIRGDMRGPTVSCTACGLPIAGRIVTASGASCAQKARFHAECFTCFHCNTALECVSFYPEPEAARLERLGVAEVAQKSSGQPPLPSPDETDLRFYCHLDFHDLFSPRCGSCHTPIEGAVILAAGKSWHEGHFFCAECGDPFSSASPFVESRGYAYCVGCHTKRTAARCRACKKQILDEVSIEALGGKWHEECFRCDDCDGDFGEEGRFYVREVEIELTEKEKRKGVSQSKIEERAVCDACEQRRLKSPDVVAFL